MLKNTIINDIFFNGSSTGQRKEESFPEKKYDLDSFKTFQKGIKSFNFDCKNPFEEIKRSIPQENILNIILNYNVVAGKLKGKELDIVNFKKAAILESIKIFNREKEITNISKAETSKREFLSNFNKEHAFYFFKKIELDKIENINIKNFINVLKEEKVFNEDIIKLIYEFSYLQPEHKEIIKKSLMEDYSSVSKVFKDRPKVLSNLASSPLNFSFLGVSFSQEEILKLKFTNEEKLFILNHFREFLEERIEGLDSIKKILLNNVLLALNNPLNASDALLLYGPPSSGKSLLIREFLNIFCPLGFLDISAFCPHDDTFLLGSSPNYSNSDIGDILRKIKSLGSRNVVILLEDAGSLLTKESTKESNKYNGLAAVAMVILDETQWIGVYDKNDKIFKLARLDDKHLPFYFLPTVFLTSNYLPKSEENRDAPALLSRLRIIKVDSIDLKTKYNIVKKYFKNFVEENCMNKTELKDLLDKNEVEDVFLILSQFNLRSTKKIIKDFILFIDLFITYKKEGTLSSLSEDNILKISKNILFSVFLIRSNSSSRPEKPSIKDKRKPNFAYLWVNSANNNSGYTWFETFFSDRKNLERIKKDFFSKKDSSSHFSLEISYDAAKEFFHQFLGISFNNTLHFVSSDASEITDGPSAGAIKTLSLAALILRKLYNNIKFDKEDIVGTGTIYSNGKVGAIGGLGEKLTAALASPVKTIFFPKENLKDFFHDPFFRDNFELKTDKGGMEYFIVKKEKIDEIKKFFFRSSNSINKEPLKFDHLEDNVIFNSLLKSYDPLLSFEINFVDISNKKIYIVEDFRDVFSLLFDENFRPLLNNLNDPDFLNSKEFETIGLNYLKLTRDEIKKIREEAKNKPINIGGNLIITK